MENEYVIVGQPRDQEAPKSKYVDLFAKNYDKSGELGNLSPNFKRRLTRLAKDAGIGDSQSKALVPGQATTVGYGLFDVVLPPYSLDELAWYYESSFPNRAAINAKVANIVGLGYDFELTDVATDKLESITNESAQRKARTRIDRLKTELRAWLDDLNDTDTFIDVLTKVYIDLESMGNGYIEIGRTTQGQIGFIGHVPGSTVRVRRKRDGFVQLVGRDVVYFKNFQDNGSGNPITSDPRPNELIHIKKYSPRNSYYGVPDILSAVESMVGNTLAGRYNIDYFENKAVPRYIVVVKGAKLSSDSEDRLYRFLQAGLRGQNHRTLYIPLPADTPDHKVELKLEPVETGIQDASFEKYRKSNKEDILIAHGVPFSRIGGGAIQNLAAALASDRAFKEQVAAPAQQSLTKRINRIIAEQTDVLRFRFNELSLTDENTQSQIDERYLRMQVVVPNEIRDRQGLPARKGGDDPVKIGAQAAADQRGEANANRQRDRERTNNATDGANTDTGRNPKGEGRVQN